MTSRPLAHTFSAVGGRELAIGGDTVLAGSGSEDIGLDAMPCGRLCDSVQGDSALPVPSRGAASEM